MEKMEQYNTMVGRKAKQGDWVLVEDKIGSLKGTVDVRILIGKIMDKKIYCGNKYKRLSSAHIIHVLETEEIDTYTGTTIMEQIQKSMR